MRISTAVVRVADDVVGEAAGDLGLVKYDAMLHAIAEAHAVDEVKDIRDKAQALEKYAAQARNFEAEQRAARIRINAELRAGELLKGMQKAAGAAESGTKRNGSGGKVTRSNDTTTLADLNISKDQSSRWQQLAENPKAVRAYLRDEDRVPTTAGALAAAGKEKKPPPLPVSENVLWLWGRLNDMRDFDPKTIARECDERFAREIREAIEVVIPFLQELKRCL
ncbi:MAG TPA: hypothetical protein VJA26_12335 [Gammaproteobacteria bacterium]|nr:hypothetical protein [Gammaproteobacteria bacterium]